MSILARFNSEVVEVLDVYECAGVKLASVKATTGKPFVGGSRQPVRTEYTICKAAELQHDPIPETKPQPNLLQLALAAIHDHEATWYEAETIWLIPKRAFLKCAGGDIGLCLVHYGPYLKVVWIDYSDGDPRWARYPQLEQRYQAWSEKARKAGVK